MPEGGGQAEWVSSCIGFADGRADERYLYWTTYVWHDYYPSVQFMRLDGNVPEALAYGGKHSYGIALDDGFVYWRDDSRVMKIAKP